MKLDKYKIFNILYRGFMDQSFLFCTKFEYARIVSSSKSTYVKYENISTYVENFPVLKIGLGNEKRGNYFLIPDNGNIRFYINHNFACQLHEIDDVDYASLYNCLKDCSSMAEIEIKMTLLGY